MFIGTPKGMNLFYELYQQGLTAEGWFARVWRVDETDAIDPAELAAVRQEMSENQYRQEFLCDFSASSDDVLIAIDLADDASRRVVLPADVQGAEVVLGVDPARFGDDCSVIAARQGLYMHPLRVYRGLDNMDLADRVAAAIRDHEPDAVCIDAGAGAGVIDRLRRLGYGDLVLEIDFGGRPLADKVYFNRRAEMYGRLLAWLKRGGRIPDDPELKTDLSQPRYGYDNDNRIKLESKDRIKARGGRSPDRADAAALTVAAEVRPRGNPLSPAAARAGGWGGGDDAYDPLA